MLQEDVHNLNDFEIFIRTNFDRVQALASLVQNTNVLDDTELDLETSAKKLQFDAKECNKRIGTITATNHNELISNISIVGEFSDSVLLNIVPQANRIEAVYQKINNEVVLPFEEATKLQGALKMIHSTLALMRGAGFFLLFVRQLQECEKAYETSEDPKDGLRLAKLMTQIQSVYSDGIFASNNGVDLTSLEIVRSYRPLIQNKASTFVSVLKTKVSYELGHHSSFHASNTALQNNLLALYELDHKQLFIIIEEAFQKSIQVSLLLLSRSLQSQRNLLVNFGDAKQTASSFNTTMTNLLQNSTVVSKKSGSPLLGKFAFHLNNSKNCFVADYYWSKMAQLYKKNILNTLAKGGPIARNLQNNRAQVQEAIQSVFDEPGRSYLMEALSILSNN